ncbi:MAG: hypothetical protein CMM84_04395 [Rhodothermaceae bacterium]|nr:hypothetical protein [Rhodothermaceae bacterium]MBC14118.1 hypothetical protein [Rhodothermaceae bacterium]
MPDLVSSPRSTSSASGHLRTWRRFAPLGLASVGLGLSLVGEATLRKGRGEPFVLYGTAALCVINAGLCLFGEAVKHRALAEWAETASR